MPFVRLRPVLQTRHNDECGREAVPTTYIVEFALLEPSGLPLSTVHRRVINGSATGQHRSLSPNVLLKPAEPERLDSETSLSSAADINWPPSINQCCSNSHSTIIPNPIQSNPICMYLVLCGAAMDSSDALSSRGLGFRDVITLCLCPLQLHSF
jgi:hypothetical protein